MKAKFNPLVLATDIPRRFAGSARLYGDAAYQHFAQAHVAIVGIGGVGSWVAEALARTGVGHLTLVDLDHIAESNVNRQIHALEPTLGMAKVLAMQQRILQINPQAQVTVIDEFITQDNAAALLPLGLQVIVDACDQTQAKVAMAALAAERGIACIMSGAAGGKTDPLQIEAGDLADTTHDRLLASVRQRLRKLHGFAKTGAMGVQVVFSREQTRMSQDADSQAGLACAGYGSGVVVTAAVGMALAAQVLAVLQIHAPSPKLGGATVFRIKHFSDKFKSE